MAFSFTGLVGRAETLHPRDGEVVSDSLLPLRQGLAAASITRAVLTALDAVGAPRLETYPEEFDSLSAPIEAWAKSVSRRGRVAYVEISLWAGRGTRAAVVWEDGRTVGGPWVSDDDKEQPYDPVAADRPNRPRPESDPVNRALRLLGATPGDYADEFDGVGMGRLRPGGGP